MIRVKKVTAIILAIMVGGASLTGCGNNVKTLSSNNRVDEATVNSKGSGAKSVAAKYREKEEAARKAAVYAEADSCDVEEIGEEEVYNLAETNEASYDSASASGVTYEANGAYSNAADVANTDCDSSASDYTGAYQDYYAEYDAREYDYIEENDFLSVVDNPLSTFAADVDTASYTNVKSYIETGSMPPSGAVRIEEMINYFTYDYKQTPEGDDKFAIYTEYSDCPWNEDTKLLMVGINTEDIDMQEKKASNFVFLIDTSGSMLSEDKLPLAQKAFAMLAENLGSEDRVSIVTYAGDDTTVLAGEGGENSEVIVGSLEGLSAYGCTNGSGGLISAYELAEKYYIDGGNNRIILATDGDMNVGLTSESDLVDLVSEEKENGIFLSVLGFGSDNLKDNKLEALADYGDGNYSYISSVYDAKKALVEDMGGTLYTVAKDVKFQIEFNSECVKGYRQIGYENRALRDVDFDDDTVDGGEIGAGHMVTVLYEVVPTASDMEIKSAERKYQSNAAGTGTKGEATGTTEISGSDAEALSRFMDYSGELATVKIRYKEPDEEKSSLVEKVVMTDQLSSEASADLSLASGVALYGMLLRGSEYAGEGNMELAKRLVQSSLSGNRSELSNSYREDFLELVDETQSIFLN